MWGAFDAARQLYEIAGADPAKVDRDGRQRRRASATRSSAGCGARRRGCSSPARRTAPRRRRRSNGAANPLPEAERDLIPAKESNLYDVYAQNLIPAEDAERTSTASASCATATTSRSSRSTRPTSTTGRSIGIGGSNNFSNINFTVQYRGGALGAAPLRPGAEVHHARSTPRRLLDWMAWSIYPGGDARVANQAEYYSNWNPTAKTYNRNNPNHVMLGNMNYIYVEDMGGIQPRSDDKIELWPIDLGYDHFMVNNLRYHGKDVTIVWDEDGTHYGLGAGYCLFIDGERKAAADQLGRFVYDPAANEVVESDDGLDVTSSPTRAPTCPSAVDTPIEDDRVVVVPEDRRHRPRRGRRQPRAAARRSARRHAGGPAPDPVAQLPHARAVSTRLDELHAGRDRRDRAAGVAGRGDRRHHRQRALLGQLRHRRRQRLRRARPRSSRPVRQRQGLVRQRPAGRRLPRSRSGTRSRCRTASGGWTAVPEPVQVAEDPRAEVQRGAVRDRDDGQGARRVHERPGHCTAISEIQVFDSGREVPPVVNERAGRHRRRRTRRATATCPPGSSATATDDGIPDDGELTYGWETVSAPEGAGVIFADATALTTRVTGTVAGDYVFRLTRVRRRAHHQRDVTVTLAERRDVRRVRAARRRSPPAARRRGRTRAGQRGDHAGQLEPGAGNGWGNWGQPHNGTSPRPGRVDPLLVGLAGAARVDRPLLVRRQRRHPDARAPTPTSSSTRRTARTWTPVTLTGGSTYAGALARNAYNRLDFEPVEASSLRIRISGVQGGGRRHRCAALAGQRRHRRDRSRAR